MRYNIVVDKQTSENVFSAIEKYLYNYGNTGIKYHLGIEQNQFNNIFQQMDVGTYENFEEMYRGFNTEVGTRKSITIEKYKYKKVITLFLAYHSGLVSFSKTNPG